MSQVPWTLPTLTPPVATPPVATPIVQVVQAPVAVPVAVIAKPAPVPEPATAAPAPVTVALTPTPLITAALLAACGVKDAAGWAPVLAAACGRHGIDKPLRVAGFLANTAHETSGFTNLVENLNYSAAALLATWPAHFNATQAQEYGRTADHAADQRHIADGAYDGRMGNAVGSDDGWVFRGHGLLQTTGRANFTALSKVCGKPVMDMPAWLETKDGAAESAAFFWASSGCNGPADRADIATVRHIINGGAIGLDDVAARFTRLRQLLHC